MSLKTELRAALARLPSGDAHTLDLRDGDQRLHCQLTEIHPLVCRFDRLTVEGGQLPTASLEQLKTLSNRLAERINYLLEPISPIEIDRDGCTVQLRSNPPQQDEEGRFYYELVVRPAGLSLVRYQKQSGAARQQVPAVVTQEVLLRLTSDFEAAVKTL